MRTIQRRVAVIAAPVIALTGLAVGHAPSAQAAPPYDPAPVAFAAWWAKSQLNDQNRYTTFGGYQYDGLVADLALGLKAVGGHDDTVAEIAASLANVVNEWVGDDDSGESYAGSVAKAAVLAQIAGADATSFGGENLIERLEALVTSDPGANEGRTSDLSQHGDYSNTMGQALAVRALDNAGSAAAEAVTNFLLQQQCDEGFFRLEFADLSDPDQSCDADPAADPDTDATAYAVLFLSSRLDDDPAVRSAIDKAVFWLVATQRADGSFGGGVLTEASNANSTGLAGWALGENGQIAAAERAAIWLRQHQLTKSGGCFNAAIPDRGAIAPNDAAVAAAATPLTLEARDEYVVSTFQALPALRWTPEGSAAAPVYKATRGEFRHAGTSVTIPVTGANPGDLVCISLRGSDPVTSLIADANGAGSVTVTLPAGDGERFYNVIDAGGQVATHSFLVLDKTTFKLKAKAVKAKKKNKKTAADAAERRAKNKLVRIPRGQKVKLILKGIAKDEQFVVFVDGKRVKRGTGTGAKVTVKFRAGKVGKHKVVVTGAFDDRRGTVRYRVVR